MIVKHRNVIFGGLGFIGQNLALKLIESNHHVLIVDINRWGLDLVFSKLKDNPLCKVLQYDIINDQRVI